MGNQLKQGTWEKASGSYGGGNCLEWSPLRASAGPFRSIGLRDSKEEGAGLIQVWHPSQYMRLREAVVADPLRFMDSTSFDLDHSESPVRERLVITRTDEGDYVWTKGFVHRGGGFSPQTAVLTFTPAEHRAFVYGVAEAGDLAPDEKLLAYIRECDAGLVGSLAMCETAQIAS